MTTFATPIAAGTTLLRPAASSPVPATTAPGAAPLRFAGDPILWIGLRAGTAINAFATGCLLRTSGGANGLPDAPGQSWTAFELSPLPQMDPAAFKALNPGLPVQMVLLAGAGDPAPVTGDVLTAGAILATAPAGAGATAFLGFAFQDRLCRDPLGAAEAIAVSNACDSNWPGFLASLAAAPFSRTLHVLDHRGAPAAGITVGVAVGAGPVQTVTLVPAMDGDTGVAVPAGAVATITTPGLPHAILGSGDSDTGTFAAALALPAGGRLVQVLDAESWFAIPDAGVSLPRWHPDSVVEPLQDGTPYFKRLVDDLRAAKGSNGAVQIAGWAVVKGALADSSVDWALIPDDATTTLLALITELRTANVEIRVLLNQFIQFDKPTIDDFDKFLPILLAVYAALSPLQALAKLNTDPAGYVIGFVAVAALTIIATSGVTEDLVKSVAELSKSMKEALDAIDPSIATWTPYPAAFADNPLVAPAPFKILGNTITDLSHIGVYHQKHVTIRSQVGAFVAYLGGIDLNSDRIDTPLHRARHPFHDIQLRITGPAVESVQRTYAERATMHGGPVAIPPAPVVSPAGASHLVQIARTYYRPATAPGPFAAFAPNGETTPVRTIKAAIGQARDFIYIEDQYFTPPDDYVAALIDAASSGVRALMLTMPFATDQPFGQIRRAQVLGALTAAWGARLHIGAPLRRFLHEVPGLTNNLGRLALTMALDEAGAIASIAPPGRLPPPPFWAFIGNELVLVHAITGTPTATAQGIEIVRAQGAGGWGAQPVKHPVGTPVLAVQLPGIYVHAKMMIVDDVFLSVGSSNLNRRGFYHDGELDSFTVPQHLRGDPRNPARVLRSRLMAEHLGLSTEMGQALFADPHSAFPYFAARSWYEQSRWRKLDFFGSLPADVPIGVAGSAPAFLLKAALGALEDAAKPDVWPLLSDPTTSSDPDPHSKGPDFP